MRVVRPISKDLGVAGSGKSSLIHGRVAGPRPESIAERPRPFPVPETSWKIGVSALERNGGGDETRTPHPSPGSTLFFFNLFKITAPHQSPTSLPPPPPPPFPPPPPPFPHPTHP